MAALVCFAGILSSAPAFAADPVQIATMNGTCSNSRVYGSTAITSPHSAVIARYTVSSGSGSFDSSFVAVGDIIWAPWGSFTTNDFPSVYASCASSVAFTATFFDVPTTPTTFSGAGNSSGSTLQFFAPGTAQYVADLSLSGGGVNVYLQNDDYYDDSTNFASSGQVALGTVAAGGHALQITALPGPLPAWTLRIYALPVAVTGLTFGQPATRPGAFIQANYTTTGDTAITAVVRAANGQPVKTLASAFPVSEGDSSLSWDATTDAGVPLADGTYTLGVTSLDPSGQTSSASTSILIDGTPPSINITSSSSIQTDGAVSGNISDALTGVASASMTAQGQSEVLNLPSFAYHESGGFTLGRHTIAISAVDGAGNARKLDYVFNVVPKHRSSGTASGKLTAAAERRLFDAVLMRRFHTLGYRVCPSGQIRGTSGSCLAELTVGSLHHLVTGVIKLSARKTVVVAATYDRHWLRRWTMVSRRTVHVFNAPGSAVANSPNFDWAFLIGGAYDGFRKHHARFILDAYDGDGTGLLRFYTFSCRVRGRVVSCMNAFGDAIRYTP